MTPKNIDDDNLVAQVKILANELCSKINHPENWEHRTKFEVKLWKPNNKRQTSFIDFFSYLGIVKKSNVSEIFQGIEAEEYIINNCIFDLRTQVWIDPIITDDSIDRCRLLLTLLQNDLKLFEVYQINFFHHDWFQIIVGKTQTEEWIGLPIFLNSENKSKSSKIVLAYNFTLFISQLEIILNNIDFSGKLCNHDLIQTNDWIIAKDKKKLIDKLLFSLDSIYKTDFSDYENKFSNILHFLQINLNTLQAYRVGDCYPLYYEKIIIGKTHLENWLIFKTIIN